MVKLTGQKINCSSASGRRHNKRHMTAAKISDGELTALFAAVDKDGSGDVSVDELREFVWGDEIVLPPIQRAEPGEADGGWAQEEDEDQEPPDVPGSLLPPGQSALDCVFAMMEERKLRVRDLFSTLDADGSGSVDASELKSAFAKHDMALGMDDVKELMDALDEDGDGEVDTREFIENMRKAKHDRRRPSERASPPPAEPEAKKPGVKKRALAVQEPTAVLPTLPSPPPSPPPSPRVSFSRDGPRVRRIASREQQAAAAAQVGDTRVTWSDELVPPPQQPAEPLDLPLTLGQGAGHLRGGTPKEWGRPGIVKPRTPVYSRGRAFLPPEAVDWSKSISARF